MDETVADEVRDKEVDLATVFQVLWSKRSSILATTSLVALISIFAALSLPNKYTSEALLAPRGEGGGVGGLSQLASQYSGLAGLAGINLAGTGVDQTSIAIQMLKSREFFGKYMYKSVVVDLLAAEGWDAETGLTLIDESIFDVEANKWVRNFGLDSSDKPSIQEAHRVFINDFLRVSEDPSSGFVKVAITHYSPSVARDWVTSIVLGINAAVKERDVQEAKNSITFLNEQYKKTNLVALTQVFADLIEQQTKTVMLANASEEYVFQVIEPPVAPERKSGPLRSLIVMLGATLGFLISIVYVLARFGLSPTVAAK